MSFWFSSVALYKAFIKTYSVLLHAILLFTDVGMHTIKNKSKISLAYCIAMTDISAQFTLEMCAAAEN